MLTLLPNGGVYRGGDDIPVTEWDELVAARRPFLNVTNVPGRKAKALCVIRFSESGGAVSDVLAYFRSDEAAEEFLSIVNGEPSGD